MQCLITPKFQEKCVRKDSKSYHFLEVLLEEKDNHGRRKWRM